MEVQMGSRTRFITIAAAASIAAWCALAGTAFAFPTFSDCPRSTPELQACIDIQSPRGSMNIKGFNVPLTHAIEIRGALAGPTFAFVPPRGTNGFFAVPVNVPGGLLGIELPIGLNLVTATAELAGPTSAIHINPGDLSIRMPIKLKLSNPLIGSNCHIGSNSSPVNVNLIVGTTSPPPPNRPISGHVGTVEIAGSSPDEYISIAGNLNVNNSFSIPGATGCSLLILTDLLIDAKLRIPSSGGNNTMQIENDVALRGPS